MFKVYGAYLEIESLGGHQLIFTTGRLNEFGVEGDM